MSDIFEAIVCLLLMLLAIVLFIVGMFAIIYGISAWVDSTWECPPGTYVVYGDLGFKSACYSVPPINLGVAGTG